MQLYNFEEFKQYKLFMENYAGFSDESLCKELSEHIEFSFPFRNSLYPRERGIHRALIKTVRTRLAHLPSVMNTLSGVA